MTAIDVTSRSAIRRWSWPILAIGLIATGASASVARDSWHRQLHIFLYPFYYVEYGIAQLGALQVWMRSRTDRAGAVADYRRALGIGGARPLPELFEAAGIRFDFSERTLQPLMDAIGEELARLPV